MSALPRSEHSSSHPGLDELLGNVAVGDHGAFAEVYDVMAGPVYGLVLRVLSDPAESEEVFGEVWVEVWRTASCYEPDRGSVRTWIMTLAHRRAVDRIRAVPAATYREVRSALRDQTPAFDDVSEQAETRLEHEGLCGYLSALTDLQRKSVTLAYYEAFTYPEVASQLTVPLGTVKIQIRDALIRLRDFMR